jgi:predicted nucleic acid-binding protein
MYLIDSSLWIEYFRPHGAKKVKDRLKEILRREEGCCCGVIVVEVLRGAKTEKDWNTLWEALTSLPQLPLDGDAVERASKWGFMLDRKGKTASTTDLLIAASAFKKAKLIHLDSDFEMIAAATGLDEERL